MIRFIQWLIFGHIHRWATLDDTNLTRHGMNGEAYATGRRFYLRCEACGNIKKRDLA